MRVTGISAARVPFIQDYPVDQYGLGWAHIRPLAHEAVDAVYQTPQEQEPLSALNRIATLLGQILLEAFYDRQTWDTTHGVEDDNTLEYWKSVLTPWIDQDVGRLRQEFLRRLGPYGKCGHRPAVVRYLASAPNESVRQRREQAFAVAPGAMLSIATGHLARSAAAIDQARPFIDGLAADLGVSRRVARRVLRIAPQDTTGAGPDLPALACLLSDLGAYCPLPPLPTAHALVSLRRALIAASAKRSSAGGERVTRVLFRAIGRSAAVSGWTRSFQHDWDSMCDLHLDAVQDLIGLTERSVDLFLVNSPQFDMIVSASSIADHWLSYLPLDKLTSSAISWHLLRTGEADVGAYIATEGQNSYAPPLRSMSWVTNRMRLEILDSKDKLLQEARAMQNCVAAYWPQVRAYRLVVASLFAADQGRATLALAMTTSGQWRIQEVSGPANEALDSDSMFVKTVEAFCQWIADHPLHLDAEAWECLSSARKNHVRLLESVAHPLATVQDFPMDLQHVPLSHLPGAGSLETRIRHVIAQILKR